MLLSFACIYDVVEGCEFCSKGDEDFKRNEVENCEGGVEE